MTLRHLHLDPVGGIAGDMFVAALLDAFPHHAADAVHAASTAAGVACRLEPHRDHVLAGSRFVVSTPEHRHHHPEQHAHTPGHTTWHDIRRHLEMSALPEDVRQQAIGIFSHLAAAEGRVHGVAAEAVTFHEVGNADSIADIVAAAWLIDAMGAARWSVGTLPLGGGRVRTAHGPMPVPVPATAVLLEGFEFHDDGIAGERVTPTGAAILRHLGCEHRAGLTGRITTSGSGFGSRQLPGISNVLRVLAFETTTPERPAVGGHRDLAVIGFEIDDQSGEDLAAGLDRLRALPGVHDVLQQAVFGKKSRMAVHVQVLAAPDRLHAVVEACFRETTTIGLRTHLVQGHALRRTMHEVEVDGAKVRVKTVERPAGTTAKAESDDVLHLEGHAARVRVRARAERMTMDVDHG